MERYIHCGDKKFSMEKWDPVRNCRVSNKPIGGLWASAADAKYGWQKWCQENDFSLRPGSFTFQLKPGAKVLRIWSSEEARKLPRRETDPFEIGLDVTYPVLPDFEKLAEAYDAIDFRISEDRTLYRTMYSWDCDSLLVLNPDAISVV